MREIREKSEPEIKRMIQAHKEKLRSLRFKVAQQQVKDVRSLRHTREDLARLLTELKSRQIKQTKQNKK